MWSKVQDCALRLYCIQSFDKWPFLEKQQVSKYICIDGKKKTKNMQPSMQQTIAKSNVRLVWSSWRGKIVYDGPPKTRVGNTKVVLNHGSWILHFEEQSSPLSIHTFLKNDTSPSVGLHFQFFNSLQCRDPPEGTCLHLKPLSAANQNEARL